VRSNALAVKLKNAAKMTPLVAVAVAQVALTIAILTIINAQADPLAPSASEIDDKASAALSRLYSQNAGARALGCQSEGSYFRTSEKAPSSLVHSRGTEHFEVGAEL
jgi:hypothetical protein